MDYTEVNKLLAYYEKNHYLQGSLLIGNKDQVIYQQSYGLANIEMNVPNHAGTRFKIASLTKAFTSMLVFILQEKGLLDVESSVADYLKSTAINQEVTIYHCLTNSSGIPDFAAKEEYWYTTMRTPHTIEALINSTIEEKPLFKPGTAYAYSSTGYLIVTQIIEQVTGKSYSNCLSEYILKPLKMTDSGCMNDCDLVTSLADSYGFWEKEIQAAKTNMSFPTGAAGMYSTTADLLKWSQAILERKLISPESYQKYLTVYQSTYACGWDITTINQKACFQHQGDLDGFVSSIKILDEAEVVIILLSNVEIIPVTRITYQIAEGLEGKAVSYPQGALTELRGSEVKKLVGTYSFKHNVTQKIEELTISSEANQLYLTG